MYHGHVHGFHGYVRGHHHVYVFHGNVQSHVFHVYVHGREHVHVLHGHAQAREHAYDDRDYGFLCCHEDGVSYGPLHGNDDYCCLGGAI